MTDDNRKATRERLGRLAWLLDSSIVVPGTNFRVGIDSLIGLIPGFGDAVGALMSSYILAEAARLGIPKATLIRMGLNVALETIVGMIPIAGDIFDMAWKANHRNVRLLDTYLENPRKTATTSRLLVFGLVVALIALIVGLIILGIIIMQWLIQTISN
ncbi:MAG: DUF4112 domain-containing protein [Gammaproteobacteria bacterium]